MNELFGRMKPGVAFEMEAWGQSAAKGRIGKPSMWSVYAFDTEAEAQKLRAKLEKRWKNETGAGPYTFDICRVERTLVPRPARNKR